MHPELTNLLPPDRAQTMARGYWLRLGAVIALAASFIVAANAALLAPTYVLIKNQDAARESELTALTASGASSGASAFATELSTFTKRATMLAALGTASPDIPILAEILSVASPGVSLTSFSFSAPTSAGAKTISVSGVADTRDDLRAYDLALSGAPFVASVNLPVSDYAAASDLSFTLTLTLVSP